MAKRKAKPTIPKAAPARRAPAITLKGSDEWKAWVEEGAEFARTDVAKLIDHALVEYLKAKGFTKVPPKR